METKERNRSPQRRRAPAGATAKKTQRSSPERRQESLANRTAQRRNTHKSNSGQHRAAAEKKRPVRRSRQPKKPTQDVVYTQPETFNRGRFILRLATVVAVVLALVFGMSIFFKVDSVVVSGIQKYSAWDVREASGIREGENLLGINAPRIGSEIKAALPYVNTVRVGIKLPGTVKIEITELDVVYAVQDTAQQWWLISSEGIVVDKTASSEVGKHTQLLGVRLDTPTVGAQAVAAEAEPEGTLESGITMPITVKNSEKLSTALSIFQFLEGAGVIGDAASVNVEDISQIELWYEDRYQVKLGDGTQLKYKIQSMKTAIEQMTGYQTGVLDVSFTTWPDEVGYNPFE